MRVWAVVCSWNKFSFLLFLGFCILCTPSACTVPKTRQPSDSKNTCHSVCQDSAMDHTNPFTEANKAATISCPSHQSRRYFEWEKIFNYIFRESYSMIHEFCKPCPLWLHSPHGPILPVPIFPLNVRESIFKNHSHFEEDIFEDLSIIMLHP